MEQQSTSIPKTSMSVMEMGRMLGLKKTDSYWLVHQGHFKTIMAAGKMRVMIDSFEEWYAGQFHHKKVDGPPPGSRWKGINMSVKETADLLGITSSSLYDLLKKKLFKTTQINNRTRIDIASFEAWYSSQSHCRKKREVRGENNGINR